MNREQIQQMNSQCYTPPPEHLCGFTGLSKIPPKTDGCVEEESVSPEPPFLPASAYLLLWASSLCPTSLNQSTKLSIWPGFDETGLGPWQGEWRRLAVECLPFRISCGR